MRHVGRKKSFLKEWRYHARNEVTRTVHIRRTHNTTPGPKNFGSKMAAFLQTQRCKFIAYCFSLCVVAADDNIYGGLKKEMQQFVFVLLKTNKQFLI